MFVCLFVWVTMGGQWIVLLPQKGNELGLGLVVEEREPLKEIKEE